jgi:GlpG protein
VAEEQLAVALCDALGDHGIESQVERTERGFMLWVLDEQDLGEANRLITRWIDQGDRPSLEAAAERGREGRELKERIHARRVQKATLSARRAQARARLRPPVLTWGLIALSVAVAFLTELGHKREAVEKLLFAAPGSVATSQLRLFGQRITVLALPFHEPYRFLTHVLVHFDALELLFQLVMLRELGRVIEGVHGARVFAAFVMLCAVISGTAQYQLGLSPEFSGMSGVVFGLLGLVWVRGQLDPRSRYALTRGTVQFMLVWLALGFVNAFKIAKWCPLFGLLTGATCALLMVQRKARTP